MRVPPQGLGRSAARRLVHRKDGPFAVDHEAEVSGGVGYVRQERERVRVQILRAVRFVAGRGILHCSELLMTDVMTDLDGPSAD